jgi:hypothetical protein
VQPCSWHEVIGLNDRQLGGGASPCHATLMTDGAAHHDHWHCAVSLDICSHPCACRHRMLGCQTGRPRRPPARWSLIPGGACRGARHTKLYVSGTANQQRQAAVGDTPSTERRAACSRPLNNTRLQEDSRGSGVQLEEQKHGWLTAAAHLENDRARRLPLLALPRLKLTAGDCSTSSACISSVRDASACIKATRGCDAPACFPSLRLPKAWCPVNQQNAGNWARRVTTAKVSNQWSAHNYGKGKQRPSLIRKQKYDRAPGPTVAY